MVYQCMRNCYNMNEAKSGDSLTKGICKMTTLENTISMMKTLPETDLVEIQSLTKKLFQRHEDRMADEAVGQFLKPMSREDFMQDIKHAEEEFARGEYQEIGEAFDEIYRELKI